MRGASGLGPLQEAHEIINIATVQTSPEQPVPTYKSAGSNPVPDDVWPSYRPPLPYTTNTTRNLQFNESQFIASPGEPCGTQSYVRGGGRQARSNRRSATLVPTPPKHLAEHILAEQAAMESAPMKDEPPRRGARSPLRVDGVHHELEGWINNSPGLLRIEVLHQLDRPWMSANRAVIVFRSPF